MPFVVLAMWLSLAARAAAGPAYMVADLNTHPVQNDGSDPGPAVTIDGRAYFAADDGVHGRELWRSDGTGAGTQLVRDIYPGGPGSRPRNLTAIGHTLWFIAFDAAHACGLWRSDGSAAGTHFVDAFPSGIHPPDIQCWTTAPRALTAVGRNVFFIARKGLNDEGLWKTDGTAEGTVLVKRFSSGFDRGGVVGGLTALNGVLYFFADDGATGRELWRSDGTAAGTRLVRDIAPGTASALDAPYIAVVGQRLVFAADDRTHGVELWVSNGTTQGTKLLLDSVPQSTEGGLRLPPPDQFSAPITVLDRVGAWVLFFVARPGSGESLELWRTDGTAQRTARLATMASTPRPSGWGAVGDTFYFLRGGELWALEREEPRLVSTGLTGMYEATASFFAAADALYLFTTGPDFLGCALIRSDGTRDGTVVLSRAVGCPPNAYPIKPWVADTGGGALFNAGSPEFGGELYVTDGTAAGTGLLADINQPRDRNESSGAVVGKHIGGVLGDVLLFGVQDGPLYGWLWGSDGTAEGTRELATVLVGPGATIGNRLVFIGNAGTEPGLWRTDGSAAGTVRLASIERVSGRYTPIVEAVVGTSEAIYVVVRANDGNGRDDDNWLYQSDGTPAGTTRVDLPFDDDIAIEAATRFGSGLAFILKPRLGGQELWCIDRAGAAPHRVRALPTAEAMGELIAVGGMLYFVADIGGNGYELWRSDGTESGTIQISHRMSSLEFASPSQLAAGLGGLVMAASDPTLGVEPWRSDGSVDGLRLLRDIKPGFGSGVWRSQQVPASQFAALGSDVMFFADDGEHGVELWRSDGSEAGTTLVRDIDPRPTAQTSQDPPIALTAVDGVLLYVPYDGVGGAEPWVTDGTEAGTHALDEIAPGPRSSMEIGSELVATPSRVFFTADDGEHGRELWAIPRAALGGGCAGDCDGDRRVVVNELISAVNAGLGSGPVSACPAADRDGDDVVTVSELVAAVAAALTGC